MVKHRFKSVQVHVNDNLITSYKQYKKNPYSRVTKGFWLGLHMFCVKQITLHKLKPNMIITVSTNQSAYNFIIT